MIKQNFKLIRISRKPFRVGTINIIIMKIKNYLLFTSFCFIALFLIIGCNAPSADKAANTSEDSTAQVAPLVDMEAVKAEIQAIENTYAAAYTARDAKAVVALYSEDAVSLKNNAPLIRGSAAMLKDLEETFAKPSKGNTTKFDVIEVYGDAKTVTEIGKTTVVDFTGKVTYSGKYMAVWEKRDGKYI